MTRSSSPPRALDDRRRRESPRPRHRAPLPSILSVVHRPLNSRVRTARALTAPIDLPIDSTPRLRCASSRETRRSRTRLASRASRRVRRPPISPRFSSPSPPNFAVAATQTHHHPHSHHRSPERDLPVVSRVSVACAPAPAHAQLQQPSSVFQPLVPTEHLRLHPSSALRRNDAQERHQSLARLPRLPSSRGFAVASRARLGVWRASRARLASVSTSTSPRGVVSITVDMTGSERITREFARVSRALGVVASRRVVLSSSSSSRV